MDAPMQQTYLPAFCLFFGMVVSGLAQQPAADKKASEAEYRIPDRHVFWGSGLRYPPRDAESNRFWSQLSW